MAKTSTQRKAKGLLSPDLFQFFVELRHNNERAWFAENKERYEAEVRGPLTALVSAMAPELKKISKHLVADTRPLGGSILRIQRDVRFSKDKSPYKVHAGVQFRHVRGKDIHAPGLYLHLEPGSVFVGSGMWHPEAPALAQVRNAILERPKDWSRATSAKVLGAGCALSGDRLTRPPKGFDPEHPLIEDLKRKDFITITQLSEKDACAADFPQRLGAAFARSKPLMAFLMRALELPF